MADMPDNGANTQLYVDRLLALPHSRFDFKIFKNRPSNAIYPYDEVGGKIYTYVDKLPVNSWKITSEKSVIAGYSCQKATVNFAGRIFEAWFTREIAVADGPYKFYGLPGLIVRVNDTRKQYVFDLTKLRQTKQILSIVLPKQAVLTTKLAVQRGKRNYYASLPNVVSGLAAQSTHLSPDVKQSEQKRINKKFNNAIEIH